MDFNNFYFNTSQWNCFCPLSGGFACGKGRQKWNGVKFLLIIVLLAIIFPPDFISNSKQDII
jgi:hypothetical protein